MTERRTLTDDTWVTQIGVSRGGGSGFHDRPREWRGERGLSVVLGELEVAEAVERAFGRSVNAKTDVTV